MNKLFLILGVFALVVSTNINAQTDQNIPLKGICIYIDYPDAARDVTPERLNSLLNEMDYQEPNVNRSFRKYWHEQTRRNVDIQHDIFYYTAPMPASFYENLQWFEGIDLWRVALEWVIANHPDYDWDSLSKWTHEDPFDVDWPDYDLGGLKAVTIISSVYGPAGVGAAHYPRWTLSNGEVIRAIQGSILQAPWHETTNLFVLFHESAHSIYFLPDTYDYDASSGGTGKYTLMSAQGPDVEPVGGPFLYKHNWGYSKEPTEGTHTYTLPADGDTVVVLKNIHDPEEFFTLEVRKNTSPGNSLFPVPLGLLIWHSDLKVNTSNTLENGTRYAHYKHSIVQKDGLFELENNGSGPPINAGDIYLPGDVFNDESMPNAHWWSGEDSGIEVSNIILLDDNHVQFTVTIAEEHEDHHEFIPKEDWIAFGQTAAQVGHDANKAFDNDPTTFYHVPFGSTDPRPHELVIYLGGEYEISEFYYTANNNFAPPWEGRIKDYELSLSLDGVNWAPPVVSEQFFQTPSRQYALFPNERAQFIRFSALNSYLDDSRTSIAEIDIRGRVVDVMNSNETTLNEVEHIEISPNPVSDILTIEGLEEGCKIKITNAVGVVLQEIKSIAGTVHINLSGQAAGICIVSVYSQSNRMLISKKVFKID